MQIQSNQTSKKHMLRLVLTLSLVLSIFASIGLSIQAADLPQTKNVGSVAASGGVYKSQIQPHWFGGNERFWYRNRLPKRRFEYIKVDAINGTREYAFDHLRLAESLRNQNVSNAKADSLEIHSLAFEDASMSFVGYGFQWSFGLNDSVLVKRNASNTDLGNILFANPIKDPSDVLVVTGDATTLEFHNISDKPVQLFWIQNGNRKKYGDLASGENRTQNTYVGHLWEVANADGESLAFYSASEEKLVAQITSDLVPVEDPKAKQRSKSRRLKSKTSPDGKWIYKIELGNLFIQRIDVKREESPELVQLTTDGTLEVGYGKVEWSPDSQSLVAFRITPGENLQTHIIDSTSNAGSSGRAVLRSQAYPLPGDRLASYELAVFSVSKLQRLSTLTEPIDLYEPSIRWGLDSRTFSYEKTDRGHQRFRVIEVDTITGSTRDIIDEKSETFIWTSHAENLGVHRLTWLDKSESIIYMSEKSGWRHLYLVDTKSGIQEPITQGQWVVRGIDRVDEVAKQVWFRASGIIEKQDPYLVHCCRVNFDGSGFIALTQGDGTHNVQYSPDRRFFIDTYSRADLPPVHELRSSQEGTFICSLETADVSELRESGWHAPEVFFAKGRDNEAAIWGVIHKPRQFDPNQKYAILEDIYAGPHDSHVPKQFSSSQRYAELTDLGFIVVKIDGMGTAHRSKAFHDVCWKNLKDAGFPDRIRWIQSAASSRPYMDLNRVGIFGTSAGGQNAAGALLFHHDFYKAAVASCGCHDNRMDKASWNEQWMGYPVGPHYAASSNVENAHRLEGNLLLMVGALDTNVPPESTFRFVDSLIKNNKTFELLVLPSEGHGDGGDYGRERRNEFFQRHLQP